MKLRWDRDSIEIVRGIAIEATTDAMIDQLSPCFKESWKKVSELSLQLKGEGDLNTLVEIWPDTGRVIFRLSDRREFARVILNAQSLERSFYDLPSDEDPTFYTKYSNLVRFIADNISTCVPKELESVVVIRDSDDTATERRIEATSGNEF